MFLHAHTRAYIKTPAPAYTHTHVCLAPLLMELIAVPLLTAASHGS